MPRGKKMNSVADRDLETAEVLGNPKGAIPLKIEVSKSIETVSLEKKNARNPENYMEIFKNSGRIQILPYIDANQDNMGLQKYNLSIFPGTKHTEDLAAIERNGVVRYITGLDEFAPEVMNIRDPELRDSVKYNIRCIVSHCEKLLAANAIDPDDPDFWSKVEILKPNNTAFWGKVQLSVSNEPLVLEPAKDVHDLIKLMAIEAGGFDIVAKSYEDARNRNKAKWYLDKSNVSVTNRTSLIRARNQALAKLEKLYTENPTKLLYVAKILDSNSMSYKPKTPPDVLYEALDKYIKGLGGERSEEKASEMFNKTAEEEMGILKLRAVIKDACFMQIIVPKADGGMYHMASNSRLGRNISDVVLFLNNPINQDLMRQVLGEVEDYWHS